MLNLPHQNRLCAYAKPTAPKPALCLLLNRLCACAKPTAPKPALYLLPNRLCIGTKPAFSFWINISTVSEVRFDCQGLGLVARNEASILVFDTKPVLYRPVLDQIQFCSFDRGCKTCLDTKPVLDQGRFCSLTDVTAITCGSLERTAIVTSKSIVEWNLFRIRVGPGLGAGWVDMYFIWYIILL